MFEDICDWIGQDYYDSGFTQGREVGMEIGYDEAISDLGDPERRQCLLDWADNPCDRDSFEEGYEQGI